MNNKVAYWITPKGKIIEPETYHIGTVIKYPKKFGMTDDQIKKIYDKYDEKISPYLEGKAREEIMTKLLKRKFIRIRRKIMGSYTIQINKLDNKISDYIWEWANKETKITSDKYSDVHIHQIYNNTMIRTSLDRIASGEPIKESIGGVKRVLIDDEVKYIRIYKEDEINELPDYFDYAESLIDENTEQDIIDEIFEHNNKLLLKYLK